MNEPVNIEYSLKLQPKQHELREAIESGPLHPLYGGARGGGKSYSSRHIQVYRRLVYPNTGGLLIRRLFREVYGNHIRRLMREYPPISKWYNSTDKSIRFPNGSYLDFGHCEHTNDIYQYQGLEYEDIAVEEVTQFEHFMWDLLRGSCRTTRKDIKRCMWATGNPGGIGHFWVKRLWIDRDFDTTIEPLTGRPRENPDDYCFIPAKLTDNQALMEADPDYISSLQTEDEAIRRGWIDGDWNIFVGQFFSMWRDYKIRRIPFDVPPSWLIFQGIDYGENNPTSFGRYALSHEGELVRLWGYYMKDRSADQHASAIRQLIDNCPYTDGKTATLTLADPSMWTKRRVDSPSGVSAAQVFSEHGIHLTPASNDRINGWRACSRILRQGNFYAFADGNEDFFRTVPAVSRDDKNIEDVAGEGEDHCADEFRYVVSHLYKPAKQKVPVAYRGTLREELDLLVEGQQRINHEDDFTIDSVREMYAF